MIDSHCHLHHIELSDIENPIDYCINQAIESEVSQLLCVAITLEEHEQLCQISEEYTCVDISTGQHPNDTLLWDQEQKDRLFLQAKSPLVIAIGETGLDYFRNDEVSTQKTAFADHIACAIEHKKPLIIHTRDAFNDTIDMLKAHNAGDAGGIFHCFTGDKEQARRALDLGFHLSFSGIITFKNAHQIREAAKYTPLDRTLIETDSPYLSPHPLRGQVNQPKHVIYVCEKIAEIHHIAPAEVSEITDTNFKQLFK